MSTRESPLDAITGGEPNLRRGYRQLPAIEIRAPQGLSLRSNFAWALTGNVVYAVCQWGVVVALAKIGNSTMVGQFSLGLAIVSPVMMFANFDLRAVQASDARRMYRFAEYFRLRVLTTLAALATIGATVWFSRYQTETALIILTIALAKGFETLSDIHYGLFQLNDRLDQTGRSLILRGLLSVATIWVGLQFTHEIIWACACLALAWFATFVLFDFRIGRRLVARTEDLVTQPTIHEHRRSLRLLWMALPLGVVTTIASVNLHMPRYFVHSHMGEHQLGIFSGMAYSTVAVTIMGDSLSHSAIPRISRLYAAGRLAEFRRLLFRLLLAAVGIGLLGVLLVHAEGARLLGLIYSPEYASYPAAFTLLTAGAAIHFAASMLTSGITSARQFPIQLPLYALVGACTAWGCACWVPTKGLTGAALGVMTGAIVRLVLAALIVKVVVLRCASSGHARLGPETEVPL